MVLEGASVFGQRLKVTVCVRVCMYVKWLHVSHQEAFWDSLSFKGGGLWDGKEQKGRGKGFCFIQTDQV